MVKNREYLEELTKGEGLEGQPNSSVMWDVSNGEAQSELKSVLEFATNERHSPLLSKAAWAYKDTAQAYIADQVAPIYPVTDLSGKYRAFDERMFYDRPDTNRGDMSVPAKVTFGSSLTDYTLSGRALAMRLSNLDRSQAIAQYGSIANWTRICTLFLTRLLLLDREMSVASMYQTTTNFASGFTATASPIWSNAAATLQADVMTGEDALMAPRDTIIMGYNVKRECQKHSAIQGATTVSVQDINQGMPYANMGALENYFDSKIIVGAGRYNSTPGTDTPTMSRIWLDDVIIAHLAQDPGGPELSAPFARTFKLNTTEIPNSDGWSVKTIQDGSTMAGSTVLMVGYWADERVFAQKSGYHLTALT